MRGTVLRMQKSATARIGPEVRRIRKLKGWSIAALATNAGIAARTVVNVETGAVSPRIDIVQAIATALDVTVGDLMEPSDVGGDAA